MARVYPSVRTVSPSSRALRRSAIAGGEPGRDETELGMARFLKSRTTLGVRDVLASIDFYEKAVGFTVLTTMGEPPTFALIGHGEAGLGLGRVEYPAVADFACCYFNVDGVEELHQRCVDAGATITGPLTHQPWGNYDFVVADPDGHQIAFGEVPADHPD
jgi:predicted enzyme related to lactoylglutathione lyase